jgi:hypothetical protein
MRSAFAVVGLCVLAGCLALGVSHGYAEEDSVTTKLAWEYKLVSLLKFAGSAATEEEMCAKIESELNVLGADGWEVCQSVHNGLILKRPK